ncbi:acyltransferase family protein [Roseicyclus sp.]
MSQSIEYRADVDGLRAVAVVAVILFHSEINLGPVAFPGGFLGVDVFFVISGFLITSLLCRELQQTGRVSITRFYARRLRRIAPALISTCLITILAAQFFLLPHELERFNLSLLATLGFVANVFFWNEIGYFSPAADQQPLLHMWSLAVEEQYYVVFPLALWASVRWLGWRATVILTTIFVLASATLHAWGAVAMRSASFYLTPFRIWELLAGAIIAITGNRAAMLGPAVRTGLGLIGACLVIIPMVTFDPLAAHSVFPVTLAAVAGTCIIILAGPQSGVGKVLSSRPMVGIGLISFSLYLVHQPILAFARVRSLEHPSEMLMTTLALLCLPLAYLSWRFIETPFRRRESVGPRIFFSSVTAGSLLIVAVGLGAIQVGIGHRWNSEVLAIIDSVNAPTNGLSAICHGDLTSSECVTGDAPRVVLWGDSYIMHLVPGLVAQGISFRQLTRRGCRPTAIEAIRSPELRALTATERRCERFNADVLALITEDAAAGRLDHVLISSRAYGLRAGSLKKTPTEENLPPERVAEELGFILSQLEQAGVSVGLVSAPPPAHFDPGQCYMRSVAYDDNSSDCTWSFPEEHGAYPLAEVAKQYGAHFLDLSEILCPDGLCAAARDGLLIYRDNGHLTPRGSEYVFQSDTARRFLDDLGITGGAFQ